MASTTLYFLVSRSCNLERLGLITTRTRDDHPQTPGPQVDAQFTGQPHGIPVRLPVEGIAGTDEHVGCGAAGGQAGGHRAPPGCG